MTDFITIKEKKTTVTVPLLIGIAVIILGWYVFFSGSSQVTFIHKYIFVALVIFELYNLYFFIRRKRSDIPYLTLSDFSLKVYSNLKTKEYMWRQVIDWEIKADEGLVYLILIRSNDLVKIRISGLEKNPDEISKIISDIFKTRLNLNP